MKYEIKEEVILVQKKSLTLISYKFRFTEIFYGIMQYTEKYNRNLFHWTILTIADKNNLSRLTLKTLSPL